MHIRAWGGGAIAYGGTQSQTWLKRLSIREEYTCQCCFLSSSYPLSPRLCPHVLLKMQFGSMLRCHWRTMHACVVSSSVTSDFVTPWTVVSARLLCPWNFPGRILEWIAISSSRGSSQPREWSHVSCVGKWVLYHWATWEAFDELQDCPKSQSLTVLCWKGWWESNTHTKSKENKKMAQPSWKGIRQDLAKPQVHSPFDPAIPIPGISVNSTLVKNTQRLFQEVLYIITLYMIISPSKELLKRLELIPQMRAMWQWEEVT